MADRERIDELRGNLETVRGRIAEACARAGRPADAVRLVAVTKYMDLELVRLLLELGHRDLGENRVQQLVERAGALGADGGGLEDPYPDGTAPRWHMIGHLQRNKVRKVVDWAHVIHSLDSVRLVDELERQAAERTIVLDALIEVNVSGEESKEGIDPDGVAALAEHVAGRPHLRLRGLMTMAPYSDNAERARPHFARLRGLLEQLREAGRLGPDAAELSMGMTGDYTVAIEEGATIVRVGSALYEGLTRT